MKASEKVQPKVREGVVAPKPPAPRNPRLSMATEVTLRDVFAAFALAKGVHTAECYNVADQLLVQRQKVTGGQ
jgi:hypothetical protein